MTRHIRALLKISILTGIISTCVFSLSNNFAYIMFLKLHYKYEEFKIKKEITRLIQEQNKNALSRQDDAKLADLRERSVQLAGEIGKKILIEESLRNLLAKNSADKYRAIEELTALGDENFLPYLSICFSDPDPEIRRRAIEAVGNMGKDNENN